MNRTRLLFVDDDESILEGLRNLLRRQRHVWDMAFATSGEQALELLARAPVDVIVSDMRMPGMDGAALLKRVQDTTPGVVRIVLSGHAEREAICRAMSVAHQFLSKPCEPEVLRETLARTSVLQEHLNHGPVRAVVGALDKLPSLPAAYRELTRALARADVGTARLAAIVERDSAMAVKVLQLVNSPYFGLSQRVVSIQEAVGLLGVELLKGLALGAHVFAAMPVDLPTEGAIDRMQRHAQLTARIARRIVPDTAKAEEAFTAGMVHDVGQMVLALSHPEAFADISREERDGARSLPDLERDAFGVTHAGIGAYLLGTWGLPLAVVEAVSFHMEPSSVHGANLDVLAALHVADEFAEAAESGALGASPYSGLDRAFLSDAGYLPQLSTWEAMAVEELRGVAATPC